MNPAMNLKLLRWLPLAVVVAAGTWACSKPKPDYLPAPATIRRTIPEEDRKASKKANKADPLPATVTALVAHDTEGKPVLVELQESTGDPFLDQRAIEMIMTTHQFKPGKADTVMVKLNVKAIPRE